jgi:hypothetical protein
MLIDLSNLSAATFAGAWVLGVGLYIMAQAFVREIRPRDDRIRISIDKRRWMTIGRMTPAGYFFQGLPFVSMGALFLVWEKLVDAEMEKPAFAATIFLFFVGIIGMLACRRPIKSQVEADGIFGVSPDGSVSSSLDNPEDKPTIGDPADPEWVADHAHRGDT